MIPVTLFVPLMHEFYCVWILILIFPFLILCWFLFAPLELQIDTRTPRASVRWVSIGLVMVLYEKEKWWLKMSLGFFHKQWDLEKLIVRRKKKIKAAPSIHRKRPNRRVRLKKVLNVIKTFRVIEWELAIDTDDVVRNAWLYPLNFFPRARRHVNINFAGENFLAIKIRNAPWKLAYAFLK